MDDWMVLSARYNGDPKPERERRRATRYGFIAEGR